jgi:hypothetical protein
MVRTTCLFFFGRGAAGGGGSVVKRLKSIRSTPKKIKWSTILN